MIIRPSTTLLLPLILLAGCRQPSGASDPEMAADILPVRRFVFTYAFEVPAAPPGARRLEVWIPLPVEDPGVQEVDRIRIQAPPGHEVTTEPRRGNRMIHLAVEEPSAPLAVTWSARVTRYEDRGQGTLPGGPIFLEPTRLIPTDGVARRMARELGVVQTERPIASRARIIYEDVLSSMEYDKSVPGYGRGDFERAVQVCKGNCTDFHSRFIGVARAAGIPVRFTMGISLGPAPEGSGRGYHCWAHFHDGTRWLPVDISEADKVESSDPEKARWYFGHLDPDRISLTFGRDIVLAPPQEGPPLNDFVFPYVEVDGRALPLDPTMWSFSWRDLESP